MIDLLKIDNIDGVSMSVSTKGSYVLFHFVGFNGDTVFGKETITLVIKRKDMFMLFLMFALILGSIKTIFDLEQEIDNLKEFNLQMLEHTGYDPSICSYDHTTSFFDSDLYAKIEKEANN